MKKIIKYLISFVLIIIIGLLIQAKSGFLYSEKVVVVEQVEVNSEENLQQVTGHFLKNSKKVVLIENYYENEAVSTLYQSGNQLIVTEKANTWQIVALKRDGYVFIVIASFILLIVAVGGRRGLGALAGLGINSLLLILFLWLNQKNSRLALPYLMSVYTILATFLAMGTSYGFKKIDIRKLAGTLGSVFVAFLICTMAMNLLRDNGLRYEEMQFITRPYRSVFLAGLLIGAIGASMDNVVTIISSLDEIRLKNPDLSAKKIIRSGQEIAQDTVSSMVNVLMFAYLSGSIPAFIFYLANGWNFTDNIGLHLSLEILRTLCGGFAIVLSVPLALVAFLLAEKIKGRKPA